LRIFGCRPIQGNRRLMVEKHDEWVARGSVGGMAGAVQVTGHLVTLGDFDERRHRTGAWLEGLETAGMKDAA
jgi:hypothetical protein